MYEQTVAWVIAEPVPSDRVFWLRQADGCGPAEISYEILL